VNLHLPPSFAPLKLKEEYNFLINLNDSSPSSSNPSSSSSNPPLSSSSSSSSKPSSSSSNPPEKEIKKEEEEEKEFEKGKIKKEESTMVLEGKCPFCSGHLNFLDYGYKRRCEKCQIIWNYNEEKFCFENEETIQKSVSAGICPDCGKRLDEIKCKEKNCIGCKKIYKLNGSEWIRMKNNKSDLFDGICLVCNFRLDFYNDGKRRRCRQCTTIYEYVKDDLFNPVYFLTLYHMTLSDFVEYDLLAYNTLCNLFPYFSEDEIKKRFKKFNHLFLPTFDNIFHDLTYVSQKVVKREKKDIRNEKNIFYLEDMDIQNDTEKMGNYLKKYNQIKEKILKSDEIEKYIESTKKNRKK
jgi:hypothetical protein